MIIYGQTLMLFSCVFLFPFDVINQNNVESTGRGSSIEIRWSIKFKSLKQPFQLDREEMERKNKKQL